jgi:hypothetical protein
MPPIKSCVFVPDYAKKRVLMRKNGFEKRFLLKNNLIQGITLVCSVWGASQIARP